MIQSQSLAWLLILLAGSTAHAWQVRKKETPPKTASSKTTSPQSVKKSDLSPKSAPRRQLPPWARKAGPPAELPVQPFQNARELLKHYDIDRSALGYLHDKQPLTADDEDTLIRVLFHVPRFRLDDVHRWSARPVPWDDLLATPESHRADYYRLKGRVTRVEQAPLIKELAALLQFDHYYRVTFVADESADPILICARQVPRAWQMGIEMDAPVSTSAMFMKLGETSDQGQQLIFVTRRIHWHPESPNTDDHVSADQVLLARLGMDVGLFDQLLKRHGQGIGSPERECFYRMMAAINQSRAADTLPASPPAMNLTQLLLRPTEHHGKMVRLEATLRRLTPIDVSDDDINAAFNISSYYQLDTFVSLGRKTIRLGKEDDPDAPVFEGQFPVTICVAKLPPELQRIADQQLKDGERNRMLNEPIQVKGVFFKIWSYHTQFVDSSDSTNRQVSPMLIAYAIEMEKTRRSGPLTGLAVGVVFILLMGSIWFYVWRNSRKDNDSLKKLRANTRPEVKF